MKLSSTSTTLSRRMKPMMAEMRLKLAPRIVLWLIAGVVTLASLGGIVLFLLNSTTFSLSADRRSVSAETELGRSVCTKRLTAEFPFVSLQCHPQSELSRRRAPYIKDLYPFWPTPRSGAERW